MFINARTKLRSCSTLGDQVRVYALRLGGGWASAREDLAALAEEWFGRDPTIKRGDFSAICREVFRTE